MRLAGPSPLAQPAQQAREAAPEQGRRAVEQSEWISEWVLQEQAQGPERLARRGGPERLAQRGGPERLSQRGEPALKPPAFWFLHEMRAWPGLGSERGGREREEPQA